MQHLPIYDVEELDMCQDMYEDARRALTSDSAFLMMGTGVSGLPPGVRGIPRAARTFFFGGGRRPHVIKRTALIGVLAVV